MPSAGPVFVFARGALPPYRNSADGTKRTSQGPLRDSRVGIERMTGADLVRAGMEGQIVARWRGNRRQTVNPVNCIALSSGHVLATTAEPLGTRCGSCRMQPADSPSGV